MGDHPVPVFSPLVTITPWSLESCGMGLTGYIEPFSTVASAAWGTANKALYVPFRVGVPITVRKMFAQIGGTANGNLDVGIYNSQGNLLVSMGATAQGTVSVLQSLDIADTAINPGLYYMGLSCSSATGTFWTQTLTAVGLTTALGIMMQLTAHPLPATATFARDTGTNVPSFGLTTRVVV